MKNAKKILILISAFILFNIFTIIPVKADAYTDHFTGQGDIVYNSNIAYTWGGWTFETVTQEEVGFNQNTGNMIIRYRYYLTQWGPAGSKTRQTAPVQVFVDGQLKGSFNIMYLGYFSNRCQFGGQIDVEVKSGTTHLITIKDDPNYTGNWTTVSWQANKTYSLPRYSVNFKDWNNTLLKRQIVEKYHNATPPSNPSRSGYTFTGWNGDYNRVMSNRDIYAQYDRINYPPVISNVRITDKSKNGFTIKATVRDDIKVEKVSFPTWTDNAGQDDLFWRNGALNGNEVSFRVNRSEHKNEFGKYITHIYAYDNQGAYSTHALSVNLINSFQVTEKHFYLDSTGTWNLFKTINSNINDGTLFYPKNVTAPEGYKAGNNFNYYKASGDPIGSGTIPKDSFTVSQDMLVHIHYYLISPTLIVSDSYLLRDDKVDIPALLKKAKSSDYDGSNISNKIKIVGYKLEDGIRKNGTEIPTNKIRPITLIYSVTNDKGATTEKEAKLFIVEKGSNTVEADKDAKIYARFISKEKLVDGKKPLDTLQKDSIWKNEFYQYLVNSLNKDGDDALKEFDYINSKEFQKGIR